MPVAGTVELSRMANEGWPTFARATPTASSPWLRRCRCSTPTRLWRRPPAPSPASAPTSVWSRDELTRIGLGDAGRGGPCMIGGIEVLGDAVGQTNARR